MGDILSREEMEALVSTEGKEKTDAHGKIIRPYDFHVSKRFSKEHLRIFQMLMEDFCHRLKNYLSLRLRLDLEINIMSIKQTAFKDFSSLSAPTFIAIFNMAPLDGKVAFEIDSGFLLFLMERLLGGEIKEKPAKRELTQIETDACLNLVHKMFFCFRDAFSKEIKFEPRIESVESSPHFVVISPPNEAVLLLTLEIRIKDTRGIINICLPYLILDSLIPHLNIKRWFMHAQKKSEADSEILIKKHLGEATINLTCQLGNCEVTLQDLLNLQAGDYLRLDTHKDSLLELCIGDVPKFLAQPGLVDRRIAVKVASVVTQ